MKPHYLAAACAALTLAACATAPTGETASAPRAREATDYVAPVVLKENATIPFASGGGIRDWDPQKDGSLLIEARSGKYYRATFMGRCTNLKFANAIVWVADPTNQMDRFTVITADSERCPFKSLDEVAPPPKKQQAAAVAEQPS